MQRWEDEYAEFVAASLGPLRRQAYARCGDWPTAERLVESALVRLYRRWPGLGYEPPDAFTQRTLLYALRRHRRTVPPQELEPPMGIDTGRLMAAGRRLRRRDRLVGGVLSVVLVAAAGAVVWLLSPGGPGGGPAPIVGGCMDGVPGPTPLPSLARSPGVPAYLGDYGLDRLAVLDLPLPQPEPLASPPVERLACVMADRVIGLINPPGLDRVDLGLPDGGDQRVLAPLPDPEIAPGALTTSIQIISGLGYGTVTVSVAPTTRKPDRAHCERLSFCKLSSVGGRGEVMEQYGLRDIPETQAAGFRMGTDAELWSAVVYTGHTMVYVSITNTPDVRAALPASRVRAPLGAQITILALDPRLAVYDPPSDAVTATAAPR